MDRLRAVSRLQAWMLLVSAVSVPVVLLVAEQAVLAGTAPLQGRLGLVVLLFSAVLVAGEMWPIPVSRGEESSDEITVSSTFGLALLLVAPVFYTVVAQAVALLIDWRVRDRKLSRVLFNTGQYALAFVASRAVYSHFAGEPFTPTAPGDPDLLAAVLAGATFLLVNNGLVAVAVSLALRVRVGRLLATDLSWQLMTSAPLLGLGPVAAHAALWTPASVILLLIPIVALHRSGSLAMRREQEALRDPLTGLANRTLLTTATSRALHTRTGTTGLLLLDLDHFKDVNDTLGHAVGDQLLLAVSERLTSHARADDLVARLGGDEFVVLMRGCAGAAEAEELAARLGEAVRAPYEVSGVTLTVGCSIGIGLAPDHVDSVEGLLRCADVALYEAKVVRGTHALYDRANDQHSVAQLGLQADLRSALENPADEQVYVVYQPQLDLRTGRTSAVEALVRWTHPQLGELSPDAFVPMAENTSLIDLLFHRVLRDGLAQVARWAEAGRTVTLAVNLSARQLSDLTLPETVAGFLDRAGVPASRLVLEVTESRLLSDRERNGAVLRGLQALGVAISIDDFGTGYSSLSYLQQLELDELKIDKSFTRGLGDAADDTGSAMIVRSTIELGHALGLRVVAEGVETAACAQVLARMGCDVLQGYHLARPARAEVAFAALTADSDEPGVSPVLAAVPAQLESR